MLKIRSLLLCVVFHVEHLITLQLATFTVLRLFITYGIRYCLINHSEEQITHFSLINPLVETYLVLGKLS